MTIATVHADPAFRFQGRFRHMSGGFAAFYLAFLGPVTVVAVSALGTHHVRIATAAGVAFLQVCAAFLALDRSGSTGTLIFRSAESFQGCR